MNDAIETNYSGLILHNALIVTMDDELLIFRNSEILVENDTIVAIGQSSDIVRDYSSNSQEIIDLHGQFLLPGLINRHVHTSQQLATEIADDVDLLTWLHHLIWRPYESNMTKDDSYISTLLCGIELVHSGQIHMNDATKTNYSGLILHNALIVTMDDELRVFRNGGIFVENDTIIAIGQSSDIVRDYSSNSQKTSISMANFYFLVLLFNIR
ncbi:hypothetical protein R6Q59_012006 [Mikania micrantha]